MNLLLNIINKIILNSKNRKNKMNLLLNIINKIIQIFFKRYLPLIQDQLQTKDRKILKWLLNKATICNNPFNNTNYKLKKLIM